MHADAEMALFNKTPLIKYKTYQHDWSNSPKHYEDVFINTIKFPVPFILPIAQYEDIHIPIEAILHYDFLEQDQFIDIFERRIEYLNEQIKMESDRREELWRSHTAKMNPKRKKKMEAMGGPFKGEMTEREVVLRKKRNRCEMRLKLCRELFAQERAFPWNKLPTEIHCMILSHLVIKNTPVPAREILKFDRQIVVQVSREFRQEASYTFFTRNTFFFRSPNETAYIFSLCPSIKKLIRSIHFALPKATRAGPMALAPGLGKTWHHAYAYTDLPRLLNECKSLMHLQIRASFTFHSSADSVLSTFDGNLYAMDCPLLSNLLYCHNLKKTLQTLDIVSSREWIENKEDHEFCRAHLEACLRENLVPDSWEAVNWERRREDIEERLNIGEVAETKSEKLRLEWDLRGLGYSEKAVVAAMRDGGNDRRLTLDLLQA